MSLKGSPSASHKNMGVKSQRGMKEEGRGLGTDFKKGT